MGFAASLALFGVVAIAIPIIIHLTKAKQAPVVWVGDIRLLKGQNAKRFKPTNIDNWPLFILRVLIVLAATLAAAKPYLYDVDIDNRPLALLTPDWLANASDAQIDQLVKHYDVQHLSWQAVPSAQMQNLQLQSFPLQQKQSQQSLSPDSQLWGMLSYFDQMQPPSQAFHVFSTERLAPWYEQSRPVFSREINWHLQAIENDALSSPRALIINHKGKVPELEVLTQALQLLGYEVNLETAIQSAYQGDVIINLDTETTLTDVDGLNSIIINGGGCGGDKGKGDWLQGAQDVDFIFRLRQLIETAYEKQLPANLPPHFVDAKLSAEQLQVNVNQNLYQSSLKPRFFDVTFIIFLLILVMCERLLSEYGSYRRTNMDSDNDD